jgi:hypothetical protein
LQLHFPAVYTVPQVNLGCTPAAGWAAENIRTASLFKTVKLTEKVLLRLNADFLNNVFNMPGTPNPSVLSGLISTEGSYNSPRTLQLTGRLTF